MQDLTVRPLTAETLRRMAREEVRLELNQEASSLRVGAAYESATSWHGRVPPPGAE